MEDQVNKQSEAARLIVDIRRYYALDGNGQGGNCHIVFDDYNVEDSDIDWCRGYCRGKRDDQGAALLGRLREFPVTDRQEITYLVHHA